MGAVYGLEAIPAQWVERGLSCRPQAVHRLRPECFWPVDGLGLAAALLGVGWWALLSPDAISVEPPEGPNYYPTHLLLVVGSV